MAGQFHFCEACDEVPQRHRLIDQDCVVTALTMATCARIWSAFHSPAGGTGLVSPESASVAAATTRPGHAGTQPCYLTRCSRSGSAAGRELEHAVGPVRVEPDDGPAFGDHGRAVGVPVLVLA